MSVVSSVKGVLWARKRQPDEVRYFAALAHERFAPDDLLQQAVEAENAGFDGICCSDHLAPWWSDATAPMNSGNAWVWLGAAANATSRVELGTGVTAIVHRYNPVVVAQQVATLELLAPGRAFLGVGSGEAMNEVPAGMSWPSTEEQLARTEEALTIITRLLDGERVDFDGRFFKTNGAMLYSRPPRRPRVYMSAFYEGAAEVAGRLADGVWTLGDPMKAPKVLAAYRKSCEEAGREPGEIILQMVFSVAGDDDTALEQAREWKGTMVDENYTAPRRGPGHDLSERRGRSVRLHVHEADHRVIRPGQARQADQADPEARCDDDRADERVGERPARRTPCLRRERAAAAPRHLTSA